MSDSRDESRHNSHPPEPERKGISRRGFLKGAGLTAAGTALLEGVQSLRAEVAPRLHPVHRNLAPAPCLRICT